MVTQAIGGLYVSQAGELFPVFVPDVSNNVQLSVTNGVSSRTTLPTTSRIVRISSSGAVFLNFGDGTVTAATTDMPHAAGSEYYGMSADVTYIAAYGDGENSTVTVTPMEA